MGYTIRLFDPETDYPGWVSVINTYISAPVTEELQRESDARRREDYFVQRYIAEENGRTVGTGSISRSPYLAPGVFDLRVLVPPAERGRSLGSRLYQEGTEMLSRRGGTVARAVVRDDDPGSLAFARRRAFEISRHEYESVLDVASFDPAPYRSLLEGLQTDGFRFFSLADLGDTEEARRKLHDINTETGLDIPGCEAEPLRDYEDFSRDVFQSYWYRAEGQIVAALEDEWAAMCAVGAVAPNELYHMHTGVRSRYRGLKLATALKVLAVQYAQRCGVRDLRTNNDSENVPMIAINRKMGYRPEHGWYKLEKRL
jgi:GNAT superfamily N-acetyltransferase